MTGQQAALQAATAFIHAVVWGEHTVVWDLLSPIGRATALSVAQSNGMDRVAAARIADDVADPAELDDFLHQLLAGVRRDLRSVDLNELRVDSVDRSTSSDVGNGTDAAVAHLVVPSAIPGVGDWSAGSLDLALADDGRWLVDRLVPRVAGP